LLPSLWDDHKEDVARKHFVNKFVEKLISVITQATGGSSTEDLTKDQRRAGGTITKNMFGEREKHSKTRAHQLPKSSACNVFWGMVCEVLSGINMTGFSDEKKNFIRCEMAHHLATFKLNLFTFAGQHNSFYDLLEDGQCAMIIPLLTLEEIANWKQGDPYEVLVCCSSDEVYKRLGCWRRRGNLHHMKWEDDGDLKKANKVLTAHVKALGDSLNLHWDSYFNKVKSNHKEFEEKKNHMIRAKELLDQNAGKVEVPQLKNLVFMRRQKKLFKIDLNDLYDVNQKKCIPDPSLFSFKAAVNWSGRKPQMRLRKLLSCCSPEEESDEESMLSGPPSLTALKESAAAFRDKYVDAEQVAKEAEEYGRQLELDLVGREVAIMVSDSEDEESIVSDVSSVGL
jgi:hypothetical protein